MPDDYDGNGPVGNQLKNCNIKQEIRHKVIIVILVVYLLVELLSSNNKLEIVTGKIV